MNLFTSTIYRATEWITRLAYLNLLWIFFTLTGLLLFGFFPSTLAMYAIVRDWLNGKTDIDIFKNFWNYYKTEFVKSNLLGLFLITIIVLIGLDIYYVQMNDFTWISIPLYAMILLFILFLFYLFPAFTHFDLNLFPLIKNTFFIMLISPLHTLLIIICIGALFIFINVFPGSAFIFGGSLYALITSWLALHAFNKLAQNRVNQ